jgi:long-chain acyl-CoA synthetase
MFESKKKNVSTGKIKRLLLKIGLSSGNRSFDGNGIGADPVMNKILFSKIQELMGGRLLAAGCGSAPTSPEIQRFVQACFCIPLRQGYGLTETCAPTTFAAWRDNTTAQV